MKKLLLLALSVVAALIVASYIYHGGLNRITVLERERGPYEILYREHRGPYSEVGAQFGQLSDEFKKAGVKPEAIVGIYFDDPESVPPEKLRAQIGALLSAGEAVNPALPARGDVWKLRTLPRQKYALVEFPFRSFLSIFVGLQKVYPALNRYARQKKLPAYRYRESGYENDFIMEIYRDDKIEYLMTLPR